jgi:hypothetical protein
VDGRVPPGHRDQVVHGAHKVSTLFFSPPTRGYLLFVVSFFSFQEDDCYLRKLIIAFVCKYIHWDRSVSFLSGND